MKKKTLETPRLILKQLSPSQAANVLQFYSENRDFLSPYEPERPEYFYTRQHQKQVLKWDQEALSSSSMIRFWLFKKEDPDTVIGTIALSGIIRGAFQSCLLGYKMAKSHTRQGYMHEALLKVIDYAFEEMELHRIEANVMPRNSASLALTKKLGFHEEGLALRYLKINGIWEDHIHMVLLNE